VAGVRPTLSRARRGALDRHLFSVPGQAWADRVVRLEKDTVIGIVGACILVGVMAAVFVYEYQNAPGADPDLTEANVAGPTVQDTTNVGQATRKAVPLDLEHITNVTFTLTWDAQNGQDTLQLIVQAPNGTTVTSPESDSETITLEVPVPDGDEDAAAGKGGWNVTVRFVRNTPPAGLPVVGTLNPPAGDTSVAWRVASSIDHLVAEAEREK
jgi:hypothetical protein